MKKFLLRALFFLIPFLWSIYVSSQPKGEKDCSTSCFSSEVLAVEKVSSVCTSYELKVSYSGACAHELSHFSVGIPCGNVENVWNSQNWKHAVGIDPTTGIQGFKIDDISGFGKGSLLSFTVRFTLCAATEDCANQMKCWQPQVAYKASTCLEYETLAVSCNSLRASLQKQNASCFGANDGSLSVMVESGQEPFTFTWSDMETGQTRTQLPAGNYEVVIRDGSGAEITLNETIDQPEKISITGTPTAASCNSAEDGAVDISVSGGKSPYTFLWSNELRTEDLAGVAPGVYTVTVTDESNCSQMASFTVANSSTMNATVTHVKPDCNDANGSVNLSVSGGNAPYSFEWSNGATTEDLVNIGSGLYTVTITDHTGCSLEKSLVIHENNTLSLSAVSSPTSCTDDASGRIDLTVNGGTTPYSFSWSNGATTEDLSGLTSGLYTVTVKDGKGCTVTGGYTISKTTFQVPRLVHQPTCFGDNNGSITLQEPIGGTAPFTYRWSNGETGTSLSDLGPGIYSVTITDATGCSRTISSTISNPAEISASAGISNSACNADGSFAIDLTVTGGTSPYTYAWSNGSSTEDISGLSRGSYTVEITDAHGCTISKQIVVDAQSPTWSCAISELGSMPVCNSEGNSLSASIDDADAYSWSVQSSDGAWSITDGSGTSDITFTAGGENSMATFTLAITKDGCTQTCSYILSGCVPADNGGGDPGGEDPGEGPGEGGNQACDQCFSTEVTYIGVSAGCTTYEMQVNTNGLCRHDLSHWTLAIPCGSVSNYSNSEGWKMVYGQDPTTGLYGLKIDDISGFGKDADSFTVRFTICASNNCDLSYWDPMIAYKAGQCVGTETIEGSRARSELQTVSVYPNPFSEELQFEWTASMEYVNLQIIDQYGNIVSQITKPTGKRDGYYITMEAASLPKGIYYYRLTVDGKTYNGKISKR